MMRCGCGSSPEIGGGNHRTPVVGQRILSQSPANTEFQVQQLSISRLSLTTLS